MIKVKVSKRRGRNQSFQQYCQHVEQRVSRAMQRFLIDAGAQAAVYTPIDTSTLINSQFRTVTINGTRVTGRIGYSASYAAYVHDPKVKQNFKRPTAKKEFLKKGVEETLPNLAKYIQEELKR
ncbi:MULTISPECIES: HK97 gp10 family phage protein [Providencia]|uniref:HK97 gp10 family phage protein n=1 Tax=Providencia rettgeri TaxID=587 RepID=A0AB35LC62_PRORE|nr:MULTISPECIES: HK97 gp10 family phage protein [Providencia]MBO8255859.1 HK97 gp10 family phage protein [Providencia rettgeri]MBO8259760.1 HK97 gp10 family phage protein [Providencia rettgeri]MCB4856822.1 HK97 gp10 family phage protein [Providencia rettgeri]MCD6314944.1 HK97 gp10 family phage protein [Providencia rettgeri]MDE4733614.1 HK97 gp10 family phage protein [Providencia rettgeri]